MSRFFSAPTVFFCHICVAVLLVGGALVSQYGFGYAPCTLCLWQRVPYAAVTALALAGLKWPRCFWLYALALVYAATAALAFFHSGVEYGWWRFESSCTSTGAAAQTLAELEAALNAAPLVRCDQPPFVVLGLSMAGWHAVTAFFLSILTALQGWFYERRIG
ncbi:MAG: disulfide bond formation protein B [Thalassospira sp.]|nr:disulfide bond formation protein B [Thalassospira sp.]